MESFQGIFWIVVFIVIAGLVTKLASYHQQLKAYNEDGEAQRSEDSYLANEYESVRDTIEERNKIFQQKIEIYTMAMDHYLKKRYNKTAQRYNALAKKQGISSIPHWEGYYLKGKGTYFPKKEAILNLLETEYDEGTFHIIEGLYDYHGYELGKEFDFGRKHGRSLDNGLSRFMKLIPMIATVKENFSICLKSYNELIDKYNKISNQQKKENISEEELLKKIEKQLK